MNSLATKAILELVDLYEKDGSARSLAMRDLALYGSGYWRTYPDGREEHIPMDQLTIVVRAKE
jgi:hypothetical protein